MPATGRTVRNTSPSAAGEVIAQLDAEYARLLERAIDAIVRMEFHEVDHLELLRCLRRPGRLVAIRAACGA
jgi:hypothetical protein